MTMIDDMRKKSRESEDKINNQQFDVFLSYNHEDREEAIKIASMLQNNGIAPWRDEWNIQPGLPWQAEREQGIRKFKVAAILIGKAGMNDWMRFDAYAFQSESTKRNCKVIPVFLPDIPQSEDITLFLKSLTSVDFRQKDPDPRKQLIWGITGIYPEKVYRPGVLIASLGESPVVVSAMYDLLAEQEKLTLDRVVVLLPNGEEIQAAYDRVKERLGGMCQVEQAVLDFEDADSWRNACAFLQRLFELLENYQEQNEDVYLSLAGGRKSMAGLMAWVVPLFSCVKGVYYLIDKEEKYFKSASYIKQSQTSQVYQLMHPDLKKLTLVSIPFQHSQLAQGQHIEAKIGAQLRSTLPDKFEAIEALFTAQTIIQAHERPLLHVTLTKMAVRQFYELLQRDKIQAHHVLTDLLSMSNLATLQKQSTSLGKGVKVKMFSFVGTHPSIRPVFYTRPSAIHVEPPGTITRVIVLSLEEEGTSGYRSAKAIENSPGFSIDGARIVDTLPSITSPVDSILIVPLGKSPMVATQLYTLLTEREQHTIHEVVLIYPEEQEIVNGVKLLQGVFTDKHIPYIRVPMKGLKDIKSEDDCKTYQLYLEEEIERIQQQYPTYKIDLALSGGRRGMTAMTIFAAQKRQIPYVYHTLITNEEISRQIDKDAEELLQKNLSPQKFYGRLFLQAYRTEEEYPYEHFTLFRVPVFSPDGW